MGNLPRFLSRLDRVLAVIAGAALVYMMSMTVLDIIGRTLGIFTIHSGVEQTELMMVAIGFLGLALCLRVGGNIVVDVATQHLPVRINRLIDRFWLLTTAVTLAVLAWLVLRNGFELHASGQRTELLGISPLLSHLVAAAGMAVAVIVAVFTAFGAPLQQSGPSERE
jgi:TRAP-type C4-dicarboxylate transport system permease small subunit